MFGMLRFNKSKHLSSNDTMRHLPRVLVVEDEPSIAELIAINLRHHGLSPVCVSDGEQAQASIDEVLPDVILLDWMLPGHHGFIGLANGEMIPEPKPFLSCF